MRWKPVVVQSERSDGSLVVTVGHPLVDAYLEFLRARARPNTIRAVAFDLKVFFTFVDKTPVRVTSADVMAFITAQRKGDGGKVVSIDRSAGLSPRTIRRRLSSVSGFYAYLMVRDDTSVTRNPVPRGLVTRHQRSGPRRRAPLVRTPVTLPKVLSPGDVDRLVAALRTERDRAMVDAMLLGGLRRCEVLGLRLEDVRSAERKVFIADGKGGRQRLIPMSARFFTTLARYLDQERPTDVSTDAVFVVLRGPTCGAPLSAFGLDEIMRGARRRAGLEQASCHQLRHTCFTRLREAGMSIEALQAQAGHASIETTRVYLHLTNEWLAGEYRKAQKRIDADRLAVTR
ncbi:MAG TPA: tyrosine-type recombinase/integrase [Ilumatobacteraceae bacterium]|nr:tyrosine-type recombinase/integrase [Ilumatobacteraceae bacterium]